MNQCSRNTDFESEKINNVRLCLRGGRLPSCESVVIHYCAAHPLLSQITTSRALSSCHCSVKGSLANIIVLRWVLFDSAWQSSVLETVGLTRVSVLTVDVGRGRRCHRPFPFPQLDSLACCWEPALVFQIRGYLGATLSDNSTDAIIWCSRKDVTQREGHKSCRAPAVELAPNRTFSS